MIFDNNVPEWKNEGSEPPESLKKDGFTAGYKPPAAYFNWFFNRMQRAVKEIQEKLVFELKAMAFKDKVSNSDIVSVSAEKVSQDAEHRLVSDSEKSSWNGKVDATEGDISETVVETLEPIEKETKYPIPSAGESIKRFLGKVLMFLLNIKPLESDVTYYVSTTGSDITGDGTQEKPYRTIQYAINMVPKNLNGYGAKIRVAAGTYDEHVEMISFYGGYIHLISDSENTLAATCIVKSVLIKYCKGYALVNGFTCTHADDTPFVVSGCNYASIQYCQSTVSARSRAGIYFGESNGAVTGCRIANRNVALQIVTSKVFSDIWDQAGSVNNDYGLSSNRSSIISKSGAQPIGLARNEVSAAGGVFFNENGTQISGLINTGISCTWGPISGGYIRHGNGSTAMITIQIVVQVTTSLNANTEYVITGLPRPVIDAATTVVVLQSPLVLAYSYIRYADSKLFFTSNATVTAGTWVQFNCTYLTNS